LVAVPLEVLVVERLPHVEREQLTDHLTPALALSLLTTAVTLVDAPASIDDGGAGLMLTEIAGGVGGLDDEPPQPTTVIASANVARKLEI
jgi:hypothetical protein